MRTGKEFAMVLKILDRFMSKLEAHFKVPVFHMTAPNTGKYDIVQFYFVLLDRIEKHIASKSATPMVGTD